MSAGLGVSKLLTQGQARGREGRRRGWAARTLTTCLPLFAGSRVWGVEVRVKEVNSS